jgi:hypothetical protein
MVIIYRAPLDQKIPEDLQELSIKKVGSFLSNGTTARLLTEEEERKIMPGILGLEFSEKDFRKRCEEFYANLEADVPMNGLKLDNSVKKGGEPSNPIEYLRFRLCEQMPIVASSKEQFHTSKRYKFYMEDTEKVLEEKRNKVATVKKANKIFVQMEESDPRKEMIIERMYDGSIDTIEKSDYDSHLQNLLNSEPERFIQLANDKDLLIQGTISKMIKYQILRQIGLDIFMNDDTKLAETFEDAVTVFKDPSKKSLVSKLEALLKEKINKK